MQTVNVATAPAAFSLIMDTEERDYTCATNAISRALHERKVFGQRADVCGPQGWILRDGRLAGELAEGKDWEVLEVEASTRSGYRLSGYNRCIGETFSWEGAGPRRAPLHEGGRLHRGGPDERYGFTHARV